MHARQRCNNAAWVPLAGASLLLPPPPLWYFSGSAVLDSRFSIRGGADAQRTRLRNLGPTTSLPGGAPVGTRLRVEAGADGRDGAARAAVVAVHEVEAADAVLGQSRVGRPAHLAGFRLFCAP